jgi:nitroreductase
MDNQNLPVHELISRRRSIRAFSERSIEEHTLLQLFEAARWAPSSRNEQPWRFIAARKEESASFKKLSDCLHESNRTWASQSAALVMVIAQTNFSGEHHHHENEHAWFDAGLAVANMTLQATSLDIFMHQMGGFDIEHAKKEFAIPDNYEPIIIIAFGYQGNPDLLPEKLKERELKPRRRKDLSELIYSDRFDKKSNMF